MMKNCIAPTLVALCLSAPTLAQSENLITEYFTSLGPEDAYNSRGTPLDDFCAIAQQDRANWHKFGRRGQYDSPDLFFTTPARRAMFTGRCQYNPGYYANPGIQIRNGTRAFYVYVRIYGVGGQVTRIHLVEGAG